LRKRGVENGGISQDLARDVKIVYLGQTRAGWLSSGAAAKRASIQVSLPSPYRLVRLAMSPISVRIRSAGTKMATDTPPAVL